MHLTIDREKLAFLLVLLVYLTPIWLLHYFPTQDGPNHVDNAAKLADYLRSGALPEYYTPNFRLVPNWLTNIVLAGLMLFVPAIAAEKILLSLFIVLVPVSVRYCLSAIKQEAVSLSLLAFPISYNDFLYRGFYNFIFSIPIFFFVIGYWLRHRRGDRPASVLGLAILILLLYFCHIVGLASLILTLCILTLSTLTWSMANYRREKFTYLRRLMRSSELRPLLAVVPASLLASAFFVHQGRFPPSWSEYSLKLLVWPFYGVFAVANSPPHLLTSISVVGLLIAGLRYSMSRRSVQGFRWSGFLWAAGALSVLYLVAPYTSSGATIVNPRFIPFILLLLVLWLGAQDFTERARARMTAAALGLALLLAVVNFPVSAMVSKDADEYLSGMDLIEPGSTLFSICMADEGCAVGRGPGFLRISPFTQLSGYISAELHLVNLSVIDPHLDFFPIRYTAELDPFPYVSSHRIGGRLVWGGNIPHYARQTRGQIDYVLLWGLSDAWSHHEDTDTLTKWLSEEYDLIFTSAQRGRLQLYRRRAHPWPGFRRNDIDEPEIPEPTERSLAGSIVSPEVACRDQRHLDRDAQSVEGTLQPTRPNSMWWMVRSTGQALQPSG